MDEVFIDSNIYALALSLSCKNIWWLNASVSCFLGHWVTINGLLSGYVGGGGPICNILICLVFTLCET